MRFSYFEIRGNTGIVDFNGCTADDDIQFGKVYYMDERYNVHKYLEVVNNPKMNIRLGYLIYLIGDKTSRYSPIPSDRYFDAKFLVNSGAIQVHHECKIGDSVYFHYDTASVVTDIPDDSAILKIGEVSFVSENKLYALVNFDLIRKPHTVSNAGKPYMLDNEIIGFILDNDK